MTFLGDIVCYFYFSTTIVFIFVISNLHRMTNKALAANNFPITAPDLFPPTDNRASIHLLEIATLSLSFTSFNPSYNSSIKTVFKSVVYVTSCNLVCSLDPSVMCDAIPPTYVNSTFIIL